MFYKILENLPKVPTNYVSKNLYYSKQEIYAVKTTNSSADREGKVFPRIKVNEQMIQWIYDNITTESTSMDIAITSVEKNSARMLPHTDSVRSWTLMYLIEHGGENHRTVFYKHRNPNFKLKPKMNFTYEEIIEVDYIQIPLKKWTILNAQEIHSVENIPDVRIAFQIGMSHNPWI